jgi:hypothetical protein
VTLKSTVVCVLVEDGLGEPGEGGALVAEKGGSHTSDDDVDHDSGGNEGTSLVRYWCSVSIPPQEEHGEHTAMTCMPVRSETVAEPPKISTDDTIMFVGRLSIHREGQHVVLKSTNMSTQTRKT